MQQDGDVGKFLRQLASSVEAVHTGHAQDQVAAIADGAARSYVRFYLTFLLPVPIFGAVRRVKDEAVSRLLVRGASIRRLPHLGQLMCRSTRDFFD